jgi:hypothetical protein
VHRLSGVAQLAYVSDLIPDHRRDAAGPISEHELEKLAAVALVAQLDVAHQQDLGDLGAVDKLPYLHEDEDKVAPGWTERRL